MICLSAQDNHDKSVFGIIKEGARLRHELDASYTEMQKTKSQLKTLEEENTKKSRYLESIINAIKQYSSDTTLYQILISSGLWQATSESNISDEISDRVIKETYEQLLEKEIQGQTSHKL